MSDAPTAAVQSAAAPSAPAKPDMSRANAAFEAALNPGPAPTPGVVVTQSAAPEPPEAVEPEAQPDDAGQDEPSADAAPRQPTPTETAQAAKDEAKLSLAERLRSSNPWVRQRALVRQAEAERRQWQEQRTSAERELAQQRAQLEAQQRETARLSALVAEAKRSPAGFLRAVAKEHGVEVRDLIKQAADEAVYGTQTYEQQRRLAELEARIEAERQARVEAEQRAHVESQRAQLDKAARRIEAIAQYADHDDVPAWVRDDVQSYPAIASELPDRVRTDASRLLDGLAQNVPGFVPDGKSMLAIAQKLDAMYAREQARRISRRPATQQTTPAPAKAKAGDGTGTRANPRPPATGTAARDLATAATASGRIDPRKLSKADRERLMHEAFDAALNSRNGV